MPEKSLYDRILKIAAKYPKRRSAVMPALRLAQEAQGG
jgi:NADH:ubiquinone oxidoreductase subunit E